jgi:hypothetical protein
LEDSLKEGKLLLVSPTMHSGLCAKNNSVVSLNVFSSPLTAGHNERKVPLSLPLSSLQRLLSRGRAAFLGQIMYKNKLGKSAFSSLV